MRNGRGAAPGIGRLSPSGPTCDHGPMGFHVGARRRGRGDRRPDPRQRPAGLGQRPHGRSPIAIGSSSRTAAATRRTHRWIGSTSTNRPLSSRSSSSRARTSSDTLYGGVIALIMAGRIGDRLRSLTVVEPPAFGLVRGNPAAEAIISERLDIGLVESYSWSQLVAFDAHRRFDHRTARSAPAGRRAAGRRRAMRSARRGRQFSTSRRSGRRACPCS